MTMTWTHETTPRWDAAKLRIVGGAEPGIFTTQDLAIGALVPGEWWAVRQGDAIVGFGWMDVVWGEGEILLAVDADARGAGVGAFIVTKLAAEAAARGLRVVHNKVRATHPARDQVTAWLKKHEFELDVDGERLFRRC